MIWLLIGGFVWLGALTAMRRLTDMLVTLRAVRRQNLKLEADISRKLALAEALAAQTASDKTAAEFERREAAWLLSQAHQASRPKRSSYEDAIDFANSLGRGSNQGSA